MHNAIFNFNTDGAFRDSKTTSRSRKITLRKIFWHEHGVERILIRATNTEFEERGLHGCFEIT